MCFNTKRIISIILMVSMLLSFAGVSAMTEEEYNDYETTAAAAEISEIDEEAEDTDLSCKIGADIYVDEDNRDLRAQYEEILLFSETDTVMPEGDGTAENPYKIYTEEELISFAVGNVADGLSAYWELHSDIELTADTWAPIGAYTAFSGHFDGNGHTISSSKLFQSTAMSGIFGQNSGVIKNLNVDVTIEEVATNTGALCATNYGTIENCHATGSITTSENKNIGGLVGWNENGTILNSSSSVVISAPSSTVGGLVGYSKNGTIKYSRTYNRTTENEEEELVYGNTAGGLIGYVYNDKDSFTSLISNCYTLGKVKGGSRAGGLIGYCEVYENYYNTPYGYIMIEYCYAKGVITSGSNKGGLAGGISDTARIGVRYCYFNSINSYNKYGFGVSLSDISKEETFYDWNFDEIWAISPDENNGYPYIDLRGEETVTIDGDGSEENPYVITNEKQLCYLASEKLPLDAHYVLANDIVVTANFWTPIAAVTGSYFTGVFDGKGYSVTGVHTENIYYNSIGLFGRSSGTIKNLTVESWFSGNNYAGGLAAINGGTIENCNSYIDDPEYFISGLSYVGGLVGQNRGSIKNSYSSSNVNAPGAKAGGLVGDVSNGKVIYCYATGDVTGAHAGGLVGYAYNEVDDRTTTIISNCYAMGKVTGTTNAAGLVGYCEVYKNYYDQPSGYITVENCYARGLVTEQGTTGGLMANYNTYDRVVVRYCYYNIANTGNAIGFGVKAADLKTDENLYGWDFENIWKTDKSINSGYPHLDIRGETPVNILEGNGEEDRPYLIYTEEDLRSMVADVYGPYDLSAKHFYKLMNDIEVTANFWTPIGANGTNTFNGIFDGNGYKISGIKLSNVYYNRTGLFGVNAGTIKNLTVEADITGKVLGAICAENNGTIENCSTSGTLRCTSSNEDRYVGGICGLNYGTITGSHSSATVECAGWEAGGLCGRSTNGSITYSYFTGTVSGRFAGGICGRLYNDNASTVSHIRNCYSTGTVSGGDYGGGIAGYSEVTKNYYDTPIGYTSIEYSYFSGLASGTISGGICASHNTRERNLIRHSYYNSENKGSRIGFAAAPAQLADRSLYYMWDFDNIWEIASDINGGLPTLNVRGKTKTHYLDGYGDEDDPYMIETEEDLWTLVTGTYDITAKYCYQLQNDIELTAEYWTPIGGNYGKAFNGIFDGNGYTISGLRLSNSELYEQGLFGSNTGTIKNLTVHADLVGNEFTGIVAAVNSGIIDNCVVYGNVGTYNSGSEVYTGAVSGINYGTISNTHSFADVTGKNWDTGGLVGRNQNALIYQCYATGAVSGGYAGGICGRLFNNDSATTAVIRNCYATGNVSGTVNSGGLVGRSEITKNYYGTPIGYTSIENSYSTGEVTGGTAGGLVGLSTDSVRNSILSSYYNQTNTGLSDIDRGTPLEDSAMKLQSSYVGWDYSNIWSINPNVNNGYPVLIGQEPETVPTVIVGDVNDDGDIDFADAIVVLKHDAGVPSIADDRLDAADVNRDGEVDFVDAILILKYDSGLISSFN